MLKCPRIHEDNGSFECNNNIPDTALPAPGASLLSCVREIRPREKPDRRLPDFDLRLSASFTFSMLEMQLSAPLLLLAMTSELQLSAQSTSVAEGTKSIHLCKQFYGKTNVINVKY